MKKNWSVYEDYYQNLLIFIILSITDTSSKRRGFLCGGKIF